jgi:hypothetical protein
MSEIATPGVGGPRTPKRRRRFMRALEKYPVLVSGLTALIVSIVAVGGGILVYVIERNDRVWDAEIALATEIDTSAMLLNNELIDAKIAHFRIATKIRGAVGRPFPISDLLMPVELEDLAAQTDHLKDLLNRIEERSYANSSNLRGSLLQAIQAANDVASHSRRFNEAATILVREKRRLVKIEEASIALWQNELVSLGIEMSICRLKKIGKSYGVLFTSAKDTPLVSWDAYPMKCPANELEWSQREIEINEKLIDAYTTPKSTK